MENNKFSFDADSHQYLIGDVPVDSVTQLMQKFGIIDTRWYDIQSRIRGSYVHTATQYFDENDLDIESLDDVVLPYVNAYVQFRRDLPSLEYIAIEKGLCDVNNKFAGTFDRLGKIGERIMLIDIKSGTMPKWVNIQLAGYKKLIIANNIECPIEFYCLLLKNNGSYKFERVANVGENGMIEGEKTFNAILQLNKYKKE